MKKFKKFISSPKATLAIFGAATILLLFSSVGGARAALTYYSENHMTRISTQEIDVALLENGSRVNSSSEADDDAQDTQTLSEEESTTTSSGKLLRGLLKEGEKFQVGKTYDEELSVQNTGEIDQYVRVTIYKYWVDADNKTVKNVYPGYIELSLADGWVEDEEASTQERTVLYYSKPLKPGENGNGEIVPFVNSLKISGDVTKIITEDDNMVSYDYQGLRFQIKVDVDAVQTHNAADAILSSWGKNVTVNEDGSLNF